MVLGTSMSGSVVGTYYAKYILGNSVYCRFPGAFKLCRTYHHVLTAPVEPKFGKEMWLCTAALLRQDSCSCFKSHQLPGSMFCAVGSKRHRICNPFWEPYVRHDSGYQPSRTLENRDQSGRHVFIPAPCSGAKVGAEGGAVALAVIGAAGYDGLAAVQGPRRFEAIKVLYLIVPIPL